MAPKQGQSSKKERSALSFILGDANAMGEGNAVQLEFDRLERQ